MSSSQANIRIRLAERQLARYREDVGDWQVEHDALAQDCWPIEDLIENGNHYLRSILRLNEAAKSEGRNLPAKRTRSLLFATIFAVGWKSRRRFFMRLRNWKKSTVTSKGQTGSARTSNGFGTDWFQVNRFTSTNWVESSTKTGSWFCCRA